MTIVESNIMVVLWLVIVAVTNAVWWWAGRECGRREGYRTGFLAAEAQLRRMLDEADPFGQRFSWPGRAEELRQRQMQFQLAEAALQAQKEKLQ